MAHPAVKAGGTAVITGGASGIGLAAAQALAARGMKVVILDLGQDRVAQAAASIGENAEGRVLDVTDGEALNALAAEITPDIVMANAGIQPGSSLFGDGENWERVLDTNLAGVLRTVRAFGPGMAASGKPGALIVTGSKQGITTPPGDPAYNVAKAGVKALTEALAHEFRQTEGCRTTAHLLIPGWVWTAISGTRRPEKPEGAWPPEQTVDFMLERLGAGDFYILCPDNDVDRETDVKRITWAAQDITENRPALSRWHPDWSGKFAEYMKG